MPVYGVAQPTSEVRHILPPHFNQTNHTCSYLSVRLNVITLKLMLLVFLHFHVERMQHESCKWAYNRS